MKAFLNNVYRWIVFFGIDPLKTIRTIQGLPCYVLDFWDIQKQLKSAKNEFPFGKYYPCISDKFSESGSTKDHYFHQDLSVARRIYVNNPMHHVDIGSRIDGFVAHIATFRPIEVFDIRPMLNNIPNITFKQSDFMIPITPDLFNYCDSVSSLHAIEHFGLGRYGDKLSFNGHLAGLENLYKLLKPQGKLYLSIPIGPQRIEFNAHRVFSVHYLLNYFDGKYIVDRFSFIDDSGELFENVPLMLEKIVTNYGCNYGCGIFELTKI